MRRKPHESLDPAYQQDDGSVMLSSVLLEFIKTTCETGVYLTVIVADYFHLSMLVTFLSGDSFSKLMEPPPSTS